jgi:hypothetical protein
VIISTPETSGRVLVFAFGSPSSGIPYDEGIGGHDQYRHDLRLLYLPRLGRHPDSWPNCAWHRCRLARCALYRPHTEMPNGSEPCWTK